MTRPTLRVTRPHGEAMGVVRAVEALLGREVPHVIAPLLDIVPLSPPLPTCAGLVLTSRHGAEAAARLGVRRGLPAYCVGEATALAASEAGFEAHALGGTADALVVALLRDCPDAPLLHLHGAHTRGDVAARLTLGGILTQSRTVYDQAELPLSDEALELLRAKGLVVAPVFSPRSARLLAGALPSDAAPLIVAISPAAAKVLAGTGLRVVIAERPDLTAMAECTARQLVMPQ